MIEAEIRLLMKSGSALRKTGFWFHQGPSALVFISTIWTQECNTHYGSGPLTKNDSTYDLCQVSRRKNFHLMDVITSTHITSLEARANQLCNHATTACQQYLFFIGCTYFTSAHYQGLAGIAIEDIPWYILCFVRWTAENWLEELREATARSYFTQIFREVTDPCTAVSETYHNATFKDILASSWQE